MSERVAIRWMLKLAAMIPVSAALLAGCGGKFDKPLESPQIPPLGEYSHQEFRWFENAISLSVTGGSVYVAYAESVACAESEAVGEVGAFFSDCRRIPRNLVKCFTGLHRPKVIGTGKYAIAVADSSESITVKVYDLGGGDPIVSFSDPDWVDISGLAVDDSGNIYVSDASKDFVRAYKPDGERRFQVDLADSGFGIGHVLRPTGIGLDGETLLITEAHAEKIQVQRIRIDRPQTGIPFSAANAYISVFTDADLNETPLVRPIGVAAGKEGSIFVLDQGLGEILQFDAEGNSITVVNSTASGGPPDLSDAVSIDTYNPGPAASIFALDPLNGVVHRWDPKE
jgi:outer membrane protein assembly factor BamB